jgi:dimeric dUTPase (all-alpha-NTP-PPase superfamily)
MSETSQTLESTETKPETTTETPVQEAIPNEAAKPEVKEELPKDDEFTKKLNWLAKKERKLQEEKAAAKALKEEIEQLRRENEGYKSWKDGLKKNPLKNLKSEGISFEDLTAQALSGDQENDRLLALQQQLEELKNELGGYRKINEEKEIQAQKAQEEYAVNAFKAEIGAFIDTSTDHELIKSLDQKDLVYNVIEEQYDQTGRILSLKEAADLVEGYLEKKVEEDAARLTRTNKYKSKFASKFLIEAKAEEAPAKAESTQPRVTLTNKTESSPRMARELTREERLREAASLLRFNT